MSKEKIMRKRLLILIAMIAFLSASASAADSKNTTPPPAKASAAKTKTSDIGLIVNIPSLFSELDSYKGGAGLKIDGPKRDYRLGADLYLSNAASLISLELSGHLENHFWDGPVSPYWGGGLGIGLATKGEKSSTDSTTWYREFQIPLSLSAMVGVEFFVLDFMSIFVEYELALDAQIGIVSNSIAGTVVTDSNIDYSIDTKLGNSGCIGIVIYFEKRRGAK